MKTWTLAVCVIAAGCGGSIAPPLCDGGSCDTQTSWRWTYQYSFSRELDVLFVVDDTPAIAPHLDALATGFANMARPFEEPVLPISLHAGFVRAGSCGGGTRGGVCGVTSPEQFVRSELCGSKTNASSTLPDAFACLGDFGAEDCAPAQPLSAALQALSGPPRTGWEGFLRPEAYLLIVIVSAGDDESGQPGVPTPVLDLAARVKGMKADPSQVLVSIIGPGDCAAGDVQAPRLSEFVSQFGANGDYIGLCGGPLDAAVRRATEFTNSALPPPCVTRVRDTDAVTPGLQPDCTVVRHSVGPDEAVVSATIPSCDTSQPPCWRLGPESSCLGAGPGHYLNIELEPDWCIEAVTSFTVECLSCADPNDPACAVTLVSR